MRLVFIFVVVVVVVVVAVEIAVFCKIVYFAKSVLVETAATMAKTLAIWTVTAMTAKLMLLLDLCS